MNPQLFEARRHWIMTLASIDDWDGIEQRLAPIVDEYWAHPEACAAVVDGVLRDLNPRISQTAIKVEAQVSDGRTLYFDVTPDPSGAMLEATDALGTVHASAATIQGLTQQLYGMRVEL